MNSEEEKRLMRVLEVENATIPQLKTICDREGVNTQGCKKKIEYLRALKEHREKYTDRLKRVGQNASAERLMRNLEVEDVHGKGSVQEKVNDFNKVTTPTGGTPAGSQNTYTKSPRKSPPPQTNRTSPSERPRPPPYPPKASPPQVGPTPTPAPMPTPVPTPMPTPTPRRQEDQVTMVVSDADREGGTEPGVTDMARMMAMMSTINDKINEGNRGSEREIRELKEELKRSREEDQEKRRRERLEMDGKIKELQNEMVEMQTMAVTRRDLDQYVGEVKESHEKFLKEFTTGTQAWAKRSADTETKVNTRVDHLAKQVDELRREIEFVRSYPAQNDNRTSAQIMSLMTQMGALQKNVLIKGMPEYQEEDLDEQRIREELKADFSVIAKGRRDHIRSVQRLGRKQDDQRYPRLVKVVFDSAGIRDDVMREARDLEAKRAAEWKVWKDEHPNSFREEHPGKPKFRKYFADTPSVIRSKKKEMIQVCQLLPIAGPSEMLTPVLVDHPNGDVKLLMCFKGVDGKWVSETTVAEAETWTTDLLRDFAIKKRWKTRAQTAFTSAGAFLPLPAHIERDPQLRSIFDTYVHKTRIDQVVRAWDVRRREEEHEMMVERMRGMGPSPEVLKEGAMGGVESRGGGNGEEDANGDS